MLRSPTEYAPKINLSLPLQYGTAHTKMYNGSLMTVAREFVCVSAWVSQTCDCFGAVGGKCVGA